MTNVKRCDCHGAWGLGICTVVPGGAAAIHTRALKIRCPRCQAPPGVPCWPVDSLNHVGRHIAARNELAAEHDARQVSA